ncbi:hypothetical protein M23134_00006 [Microscilla marina ATCC 23134]|uniref:Uncharacterized protein n=1 Tax=Microscilla marina ATCC 23134 TaxID=313606 RepID=A1ZKN7_MICM2|nr:hypothetical protein M23134_00006 [Microscilla marina ATCC 23134]
MKAHSLQIKCRAGKGGTFKKPKLFLNPDSSGSFTVLSSMKLKTR